MRSVPLEERIPARKVGAVLVVLLALTFAYSLLVLQQILLWAVLWLSVLAVGVSLFVVYLLYRLVAAVETLAEEV